MSFEFDSKPAKVEVDVNEFIMSIAGAAGKSVPSRTILNHVLGAMKCKVNTDPELLSQVMFNLLDNACKFTSRGSITFGYEMLPDAVCFFVRDTGAGISAERQMTLFDPTDGNRHGLALCKDIVESLHGEIGVESDGEGKGSQFWFTLPVEADEDDNEEAEQRDVTPTPVFEKPLDASRPTILVAEDNDSNYFLVSSILEDEYNLIHAHNGNEAVELFAEYNPHLVLMDISMPDMDGYEATSIIWCSNTDVPIIAVTAYAFQADRLRIMDSGFNGYISKPIDADHLMTEIARLLNNGR